LNNTCIQFNNVRKQYGSQLVLAGIDLAMREGDFLGLVGVNGAGKTTLIKCLLDLASMNSGSIAIFDVANTELASRETLAFLPERFIPPYYLSGKDFLEYMAGLYGIAVERSRQEQILATLDFDLAYLDKPVRQLSKGMSQKLGLAACFLSDKQLLILDEPMSGLDPKARAYLKQYLLELKGRGKSVFFSTHLLTDIEALCDKVAILHDGLILFTGTVAECCEAYNARDFESAYLACVDGGEQVLRRGA